MGMLIGIIVVGLLYQVFFTIKNRKRFPWHHPGAVASFFILLPILLACMNLSVLQSGEWDKKTYAFLSLIVGITVICSVVIGTGVMAPRPVERTRPVAMRWRVCVFNALGVACVGVYLTMNFVQAGHVIPAVDPHGADAIHADFMPFLRAFGGFLPQVGLISLILYFMGGRRLQLLLALACLLIPLTRLARADMFYSIIMWLVAISVCVEIGAIRAFRWSRWCSMAIGLAIVVYAMVVIGDMRYSKYGEYDVSYARAIGWNGPESLNFVGAYYYGYLSLSYENLDLFIRSVEGGVTMGRGSLDWLLSGFLRLNWFYPDYSGEIAYQSMFTPVSGGANVPTGFVAYYYDFGYIGGAFPHLIYTLAFFWLYRWRNRDPAYIFIFANYCALFGMMSFMPVLMHPNGLFNCICGFALIGWLFAGNRHPPAFAEFETTSTRVSRY